MNGTAIAWFVNQKARSVAVA